MTEKDLTELKSVIAITAAYYGRDLLPKVIQMRAADLCDLPFERLRWAYETYRRNVKHKSDPLPAQIRELIEPSIESDEAVATEAVARVITSVSKFGYNRGGDARQFIGELGWRIVEFQGGWGHLCRSLGDSIEITTAQAQWKKLALSTLERARNGTLEKPPQIPKSNKEKFATIGDAVKIALNQGAPNGKDKESKENSSHQLEQRRPL